MPASKAQQRATNKYISKTYDRINLTVPKGQKNIIQHHAQSCEESVNGFIGRAIDETMKKDIDERLMSSSGDSASNHTLLSPETLRAAWKAAKTSGETLAQFIARAVETQAKRDKISIRMGLNPSRQEAIPNDKESEKK